MTEARTESCVPAVGRSSGDPDARPSREELVRRHRSAVLAVCLAHARSSHDAEDITQDVFIRAFEKLGTLREPGKTRAWLLQIARRACADHRRRPAAPAAIHGDIAQPSDGRDGRCERLHAALARLPEDYRETITLYYLDGESCRSVAASLGVSEAAVRQRLCRARIMLHEMLTEEES